LYFTDDCFPAWDEIYEINFEHNNHARVQNRLLNREVSRRIDPLILKVLRNESNDRLEEARLLGIALADIRVGDSLLPEWDQAAVDAAVPPSPVLIEDEWEDSPERDACTFGDQLTFDNVESMASDDNAMTVSSDASHSDSSSSAGSSSSDDNNQPEEPVDDHYAMFAGGDLQPLPSTFMPISASDDEAPHILHDVEIYGGPDGIYHVDMEV
jgi:hypothetical protein